MPILQLSHYNLIHVKDKVRGKSSFDKMKTYPRFIKPGFEPLDPIELAMETEKIVCRGNKSARHFTRAEFAKKLIEINPRLVTT